MLFKSENIEKEIAKIKIRIIFLGMLVFLKIFKNVLLEF